MEAALPRKASLEAWVAGNRRIHRMFIRAMPRCEFAKGHRLRQPQSASERQRSLD